MIYPACASCEVGLSSFLNSLWIIRVFFSVEKFQLCVYPSVFVMCTTKVKHHFFFIFLSFILSFKALTDHHLFNFTSLLLPVINSNITNTMFFCHFVHSFLLSSLLWGFQVFVLWKQPSSSSLHVICYWRKLTSLWETGNSHQQTEVSLHSHDQSQ